VPEERLAVDGGVGALGEPLTPQEKRIAALAARGASDGEIAAEPFLGPETVEHHLTSVYRKRGLRSCVRPARLLPPGG
jgi:DNA-binding CsgD family transcriptional regulator